MKCWQIERETEQFGNQGIRYYPAPLEIEMPRKPEAEIYNDITETIGRTPLLRIIG